MNKISKYLIILLSLFFIGCSNGLKPMKFKNGQPVYSGNIEEQKPVIYTNSVQLISTARTNKVQVTIPVTISHSKSNVLKPENVKVTIPKKMDLIIVIPESTNNIVMSGFTQEEDPIITAPALFLYLVVASALILMVLHLFFNKNKPKISVDNSISKV